MEYQKIYQLVFLCLALSASGCNCRYFFSDDVVSDRSVRPEGNSLSGVSCSGVECKTRENGTDLLRDDIDFDSGAELDFPKGGLEITSRISRFVRFAIRMFDDFLKDNNLTSDALRREDSNGLEIRNLPLAQGRKAKGKRMLMYLFLGMKILGFGLVLPAIVAVTIVAAWKGITISLLAFMLASIVGLKSLISKSVEDSKHHQPATIVVTKFPVSPVAPSSPDWFRSDTDLPYKSHYK